jgi:hypothetical protein
MRASARFIFGMIFFLAVQKYVSVASPAGGPLTVTVTPSSANVQASGGTQTFTATVQNDKQNRGVTWSLAGTGCSGATCGTLSSTSSASGTLSI